MCLQIQEKILKVERIFNNYISLLNYSVTATDSKGKQPFSLSYKTLCSIVWHTLKKLDNKNQSNLFIRCESHCGTFY